MSGWTWEYVENQLTLPQMRAMYEEWQHNPPVPMMVAAFLGIKPHTSGTHEELVNDIASIQSGM